MPDRRLQLRLLSLASAVCAMAALGLLSACGDVDVITPRRDSTQRNQSESQLILERLVMVQTSGTLVLRNVEAHRATFDEDSRVLEATSVTLMLNLPQQKQVIVARAAKGEVYLAGERSRTTETLQAALGLDGMREVATMKAEDRPFGDVILRGPVVGETADGGRFTTSMVIWHEDKRRLLVPGRFEQVVRLPGSQTWMHMRGAGFEVDSSLHRWEYYTTRENPYLVSLKNEGVATSVGTR